MDVEQVQPKIEENDYGSIFNNMKRIKVGDGNIILDGTAGTITVGGDNKVVIDGTLGQIQFFNGSTSYGYIVCDTSLNILYVAKDTHYFFDQSDNYIGKLHHTSASDYGLEINGGGQIQFTSGTNITDTGSTCDIDRTVLVNGDVALSAGKKFQVGTGSLTAGIDYSNASVNTFSINIVGGIVTQFTKNS